MKLGKFRISTYKIGKALYNNGTTRKMSQRYFCPAEYALSLGLVLVFLLVLELVVYSAGQKYRWLIFLSYLVV